MSNDSNLKTWAVAVYGTKGSYFFGSADILHAISVKQAKDYKTVLEIAEADFEKAHPGFKVSSSVATIIDIGLTVFGVPLAVNPKLVPKND